MNAQRRDQIGTLAELVRRECQLALPVDMEEAVRRLGGELMFVDSADYEAKIEKNGQGFRITLSGQTSGLRRRFSVAHELGHLFLHMGYLVEPQKWANSEEYKDAVYYRFGHSTEEYEANEFAAAFLMPRQEFTAVAKTNHVNTGYQLQPIAGYFNVSREAALTRGRWLGIFAWD